MLTRKGSGRGGDGRCPFRAPSRATPTPGAGRMHTLLLARSRRPIYPAQPAKIADVLAAVVALGSIKDAGDPGIAGQRHVRGALTTLDFAGLITLDQAAGTLSLGPVIATWPERDIAVLRSAWSRLPASPPMRARADRDIGREDR